MNKDERIKELEKISMRLFDMIHEGSNINFKCEANDFYNTIKGQTLPIDSVIICSRGGCNNEREKEHSYCLDCRYERTMSGY